mmetsp:Transcript_21808/g.65538  ORF Transcript_21808/g.65538 Transcript_21808/m.65538 type:complete len:257 (+) Transcript_21808:998-1768(+)
MAKQYRMMASMNSAHINDFIESRIISARRLSSLKKRNTRNTLTIRTIFTTLMADPMLVDASLADSCSIRNSTMENITRSRSNQFQNRFSHPQKYLPLNTNTRMTSSAMKKMLQKMLAISITGSDVSCLVLHSTSRPTSTEFTTITTAQRESNQGLSTVLASLLAPAAAEVIVVLLFMTLRILFSAGIMHASASRWISFAFRNFQGSSSGLIWDPCFLDGRPRLPALPTFVTSCLEPRKSFVQDGHDEPLLLVKSPP